MNFVKILTMPLLMGLLFTASANGDESHPPLAGHLIFKQGTLHFRASFVQPPIVGQKSEMLLEARDPRTHQAVAVADKISVALRMPDMDHGSAPTKVTPAADKDGQAILGSYLVRNMQFFMEGGWRVLVTLTDASGTEETQSFDLTLP